TVKEKADEKNLNKNIKKPLTKKRIRIKRRSTISRTKIPTYKPIQKESTHVTEKADSLSADSLSAEERNEPSESRFLQRWFPTPSFKKKTTSKNSSSYLAKILLFSKTQKKSQSSQGRKKSNKSSKHKQSLQKMIGDLQKENSNLQKQIQSLQKDLQDAELKKNELKEFFNRKFRFIRDSIGIKKKRKEFQMMMEQLNERKQKLETLETDMILEKKEFKQKIEEFVIWREKLEQLEQEIEKRRQFLSEQEAFLNEQYDKVLSHELMQPASYSQTSENAGEKHSPEDPGILEKDDLFNALTVEAAVLQRGRIKKANKLFAQMIGYSEDELVGKHLVDFVCPNGLAGVEQHYMNRLKGVDDSTYKTVFLSKNEDEIPVKVHVKTSDFQGERAEIVTFNEV
ncbi:MAG: PAS domain S-box protein, partial [Candidatus Thermoplasmatota archaeon]|nr:PAS domain S-box protein [Candidatus Thermoplasmatota archaeon]